MKTSPKAAVRFLSALFKHSAAAVFITSLANDRAQSHRLPPRQVVTRDNKVVERFVETWDKPERALYFCVATLKPGILRRAKDNLGEIVCLHCDIDFKDVENADVENMFAKVVLPVLPTITVASGHGMHLYWQLREPLPATPDNIERIEACLRRIAYLFAGDPAVCECARLMRLPGSHNSKNGDWRGVRVRKQLGHVYKLHKLEQSFARASQLLQRRARADKPVNFFTALGETQTYAPPVDVGYRLAAMEFHGQVSGSPFCLRPGSIEGSQGRHKNPARSHVRFLRSTAGDLG
jgi:hypothetical protein